MKDRIFIDTNIFVYAFLMNDKIKHDKAVELFKINKNTEIFISIQVLNEIYSSLSKNKVNADLIEHYIFQIGEEKGTVDLNIDKNN